MRILMFVFCFACTAFIVPPMSASSGDLFGLKSEPTTAEESAAIAARSAGLTAAKGTRKKQPAPLQDITPMMAQYLRIKAEYDGHLLFYRMGDFYELFLDDALAAAEALDITLTHRGQMEGRPVPMCGVPVHAAETYLHRLIRKGFKVAVCEQQEEPSAAQRHAKAPLKRAVVRLVTPGTLSEESLLPARAHNFLAAFAGAGAPSALAWLDMSTGDFFVRAGTPAALLDELARVQPSEVLLPPALAGFAARCQSAAPDATMSEHELPDAENPPDVAAYGDGFAQGWAQLEKPAQAAGAMLLSYLQSTQLGALPALKPPQAGSGAHHIDCAPRWRAQGKPFEPCGQNFEQCGRAPDGGAAGRALVRQKSD